METAGQNRRWLRWIMGVGFALLIALTVVVVWSWRTRWSIAGRLDAIRAAGDPATIAELAPEPIADSQNAAAQLEAIMPQIRAFANDHGRFYNTPLGKDYDEHRGRGEPATAQQLAAIRAIVEKYPEVDAGLVKAAACEQYASRLDFSLGHAMFLTALMDASSDIRSAGRFLRWQMELADDDGRAADAIKNGIDALRLAKHFESEPAIVSYQIACAVRLGATEGLYEALASGALPAELHAELDRELARHDDLQRFASMLKTERAMNMSAIEEQFTAAAPALVRPLGWPANSYQISILNFYDKLLPIANEPWHAMKSSAGGAQLFKTPSGQGVMADLLIPALEAAYESANRDVAVMRSLRIYNALRKHAQQNGREATGLEDLQLLKEATLDPFSGKPLKLKLIDKGWIVYSVMKDGQDDDGDFEKQKDFGVGPHRKR